MKIGKSKFVLGIWSLLAIAVLTQPKWRAVDGSAPTPTRTVAEPAAIPLPTVREFIPDTAWGYALALESSVHVDPAGAASGEGAAGSGASETQNVDLAAKGRLEFDVLRGEAGETRVRIRMPDASLTIRNNGAAVDARTVDGVRGSLANGVVAHLAANGQVTSVDTAGIDDEVARQTLAYLAYVTQMVLPPVPGASHWAAAEQDGTGAYRATYQVRGATGADVIAFTKDKAGYDRLDAAAGTGAGSGKVTGRLEGTLRHGDGWLATLDGSERVELTLDAAEQPLSWGETRLTLALQDVGPVSAEAAPPRPTRVTSQPSRSRPADARSSLLAADLADARRRLGKTSLAELDAAAATAFRSDRERLGYIEKVRAYVLLHAGDLKDIQAAIKGRPTADPFYRAAMFGMSSVGCGGCQRAMLDELKAHGNDTAGAVYVASLFGNLTAPSLEAESTLRQLRDHGSNDDVRKSADLVVGTLAFNMRDRAAPRANAIVDDGIAHLQAATSDDQKVFALAVLGNTGSQRLPAALADALHDNSDLVRSSAVHSLRWVSGDDVTTIGQNLLDDGSERVRLATVETLGYGHPDRARAQVLADHLKTESSANVRGLIVESLATVARTNPTALAALKAATTDPNPDVRKRALTSLPMEATDH